MDPKVHAPYPPMHGSSGYKSSLGHSNPSMQYAITTQPTTGSVPLIMGPPQEPDYCPLIVSIFTTVVCCLPLGLVALILAVMALSDSDLERAMKKNRIAMYISAAAILFGFFFLWPLLIVVMNPDTLHHLKYDDAYS